MDRNIVVKRLYQCPDSLENAAIWFSQKWGIPSETSRDSMVTCIQKETGIPQWYLVFEQQRIVAGAGVIANDYHDRVDLTPNLCALFVEESHRYRGIARLLLDSARRDMGKLGFETLYLVTDHEHFYERCGWEFLTIVSDSDGNPVRMYAASTL